MVALGAPKVQGKAADTHQGLQKIFPIIKKLSLEQTGLLTSNALGSQNIKVTFYCALLSLNDITTPMVHLSTIFLNQHDL